MTDPKPTVYLIHGEDDYAAAQFIHAMLEKMGDPSMAEMNTTRLEGNYDLETLRSACYAMPFLAERRLVVAHNAGRRFDADDERGKFTALLDNIPPTTALALLEDKQLDLDERGKAAKKLHWLLKWTQEAGPRAHIKAVGVPRGSEWVKWLQTYARSQGGEIERQAAARLADLFTEEPRAAAREVDKLLAYVNFARPVGVEDVDQLVAFYGPPSNYFHLIDSMAAKNAKAATAELRRLLDEQDAIALFFSLVSHYRQLVQARHIVEEGGNEATVQKALNIRHPFPAQKLTAQARKMTRRELDHIYRRLLDYNLDIVTGKMPAELALETLVTALAG